MEAHRIESAGKARENGTIDSSKHSHVKPPAKNPECEIANTPYLKVVGMIVQEFVNFLLVAKFHTEHPSSHPQTPRDYVLSSWLRNSIFLYL